MTKLRGGSLIFGTLACGVLLGLLLSAGGYAWASAYLVFDMREQGPPIENKFGMLNSWYYDPQWTSVAASFPDDYMASYFPFVETVHLMTATGGSLERDLFHDPAARDVLDDYHFEPLKVAIREVLQKGLKPYIKTGNVPLKYSEQPLIGAEFGVNVRPPANYDVYYEYIRALAQDLVAQFGLDEIKTWQWGVLTEYENADWFDAGTPAATQVAYFKLYDYTVAALEDVLGPENVYVGAHSMSVANGYWDERAFIEHVARGVNHKTGERGTRLDFLAVSFYDRTLAGLGHRALIDTIQLVREAAEEVGLTDLRYGVDEGRVLVGWDGKPLISRAVNLSAQGAADAKLFKLMLDHEIDWFALWGLSTGGTWGGAHAIGSHIANLAYRMAGDTRIGGEVVQPSAQTSTTIDGVVSYDPDAQTLRLLVYNNHPNSFAGHDAEVSVEIRHIAAVHGDAVVVTRWRVDDENANWWPTWQADQLARGITDGDYTNWSKYSVEVPSVLRHGTDQAFWREREPTYTELSQLRSTSFEQQVTDGILRIEDPLPAHGVAFYEIVGVHPAPQDLRIELPVARSEAIQAPTLLRVEPADPQALWQEATLWINAEPVATGADLPFEWWLNPAMYADGSYELVASATASDGRTATERRRIAVRNVLQIAEPATAARLRGTVPIRLDVGPRDEDLGVLELEVVAVGTAEGGTKVHGLLRADAVPDVTLFDTEALPDGAYDLTARVHTQYGTAYEDTIRIVIRNWTVFTDHFQPPAQSWFGVLDYSKTVDRSDGWTYATDDPETFFGDIDRLVRVADTDEHLIWEVPDIDHFALTLYTSPEMGTAPDFVSLFEVSVSAGISPDRGDIAPSPPVDLAVQYLDTSDAGWTQWVLEGRVPAESKRRGRETAGDDVGVGPYRLQLRLLPGGAPANHLQLGWIDIFYPSSE